ncbi:hypothetical protein D3C76_499680 [compost metagenome]
MAPDLDRFSQGLPDPQEHQEDGTKPIAHSTYSGDPIYLGETAYKLDNGDIVLESEFEEHAKILLGAVLYEGE